jgi:mRNA interferase HigB
MRVVKPKTIRDYAEQYSEAEEQLMLWLKAARAGDWHSIVDVRKTYPHADAVVVKSGNVVTVFNIKGNRFRLIVAIKYEWAMVYVLRFLTHAEYSRNKWSDQL